MSLVLGSTSLALVDRSTKSPIIDPITVGMIASWTFNEATGTTRLDSIDSHDLADINGDVNQIAGQVNNAAQTPTIGSGLSTTDSVDLRFVNTSMTCYGWVLPDAGFNGTDNIFIKSDNSTIGYRIFVNYSSGARRIKFTVFRADTNVAVTVQSAVITQAWHQFEVYVDIVGQTIGISVDNSAFTTAAFPTTIAECTFSLFSAVSGVVPVAVDASSFWNRLITTGERSRLWNGGAGLEYPF